MKTIMTEQGLLIPKEELERLGEVVLEERDGEVVIRPKEPNAQSIERVQVHVTADVNITAPIARRLVNTELMKKIGQMIMAGEPELLIDGQKVYWKVPFLVVPPMGDTNTYPTGTHALVDARSGIYIMSKREIEELRAVARPILCQLYPDLPERMRKIREGRR